jgi:dephospho-CoA kinase
MYTIGITGGVGAGKSEVLHYLKEKYNVRILLADDVANKLKEPGQACFEPIVACLGRQILGENGEIDRKKMAAVIFSDREKLQQVNEILHPAVKEYVLREMEQEKSIGRYAVFFLEAALLIEEGYDKLLDELWYVYTDSRVREKRLQESRGYTKEKIAAIIKQQLSEEGFRSTCQFVIDNSGTFAETQKQIDQKMEVLLCRKQR